MHQAQRPAQGPSTRGAPCAPRSSARVRYHLPDCVRPFPQRRIRPDPLLGGGLLRSAGGQRARLLDPRSHKLRRSSAGPQDQRHPPRWRLPTNGRKQSRCCRDAADLQVVSSRELAIGNQSTPFASARNNRKRALRDCNSGSRELHAPPSSPGSTASRSGASCRAGPSTDRYRNCRPETPVGGRSQRRSPGGLDALLNHQPTVPCLEA